MSLTDDEVDSILLDAGWPEFIPRAGLNRAFLLTRPASHLKQMSAVCAALCKKVERAEPKQWASCEALYMVMETGRENWVADHGEACYEGPCCKGCHYERLWDECDRTCEKQYACVLIHNHDYDGSKYWHRPATHTPSYRRKYLKEVEHACAVREKARRVLVWQEIKARLAYYGLKRWLDADVARIIITFFMAF
jgi:hypothetical protein